MRREERALAQNGVCYSQNISTRSEAGAPTNCLAVIPVSAREDFVKFVLRMRPPAQLGFREMRR